MEDRKKEQLKRVEKMMDFNGKEVTPEQLKGRIAKCGHGCGAMQSSSLNLAFFEYLPNQTVDRYYCGCFGWN